MLVDVASKAHIQLDY